MDVRKTFVAALLAAAAASSPLAAHADPSGSPRPDDDARQRRCADAPRMRAYPSWCRERPTEDERERARARREDRR